MDSQSALDSHSHPHSHPLTPHGPGSLGGGLGATGSSNKRPYEGSSSESVVSFATDSVSVTQASVISGSVANSVVGPDGRRSVKPVSSLGCRQRITVVCAECKRLKLKCDRRTPCGSCTKRDTVEKCIYSQAAAEKVDVQSLNIRLQAVEGRLSGISFPSDPSASSSAAGPSSSHAQKKPSMSSLAAPLPGGAARAGGASGSAESAAQNRAFLAVGVHGASVAVNLEGITGLWVDHLGLNKASSSAGREPPSVGEIDLERLGVRTARQAGGSGGIELRPSSYASSPAEGLLSLIEEYTDLFRVPASRTSTSEMIAGDEREHDVEHGGEEGVGTGEDDPAATGSTNDQVGVSPRLVYNTFPPALIRAEIFKRFEQHHFMSPTVNFTVFRTRIEEMCAWAEMELGISRTQNAFASGLGSENGRRDELLPTISTMMGSSSTSGLSPIATPGAMASTTSTSNGVGINTTFASSLGTAGPLPPTLSFFAAACFGIALGARCWMIEQEMLGPKPIGSGNTDRERERERACSPGFLGGGGGGGGGGGTNIYDPSMPPPPLPLAPFDTGGSTSPASPASGPSALHHFDNNPSHPPLLLSMPQLDPSLPTKLYRLAKYALNLAIDCAGYEVFDTDYIHARCLQARYLLGSHHGLGEGSDLLRELPSGAGAGGSGGDGVGKRKKVEKRKRKNQTQGHANVNGTTTTVDHNMGVDDGRLDTIMDDAFTSESPSHINPNNSRRKGKEKEKDKPSSSSPPSSQPTAITSPTSPSSSQTQTQARSGPALALAPEMFGVVSDAVSNARMMGLNHDPEFTAGAAGRFSVYECEMRRRLWWELAVHDAFVAECLGETPFINDDRVTTELPADVDEESFGPDSANRPAPNIESMHGNIDGFIQRCRLVVLGKKLSRKLGAFKVLHPDASAAETHELLMSMKAEIGNWLDTLPEHLKLKEIPPLSSVNQNSNVKNGSAAASPSSAKRPPNSPAERDTREGGGGTIPGVDDSPHVIAHRCRIAISARHMFLNLCLAMTKDSDSTSEKSFDALLMLEPAMYIVRAWRYLHAVYRNEHPALFMCYALTRELFNAAVVLGHLAIRHPLFAPRALVSLRLASETMRDPSVLTSKHPSSPSSSDETSATEKPPSEAVRIIEELISKAEAAEEAANSEFGDMGSSSLGASGVTKRKHEEVESASSDLMYHFRFPFVGPSVVSVGPPAIPADAAAAAVNTIPGMQTQIPMQSAGLGVGAGVGLPTTNGVGVGISANTITMRVGEAGMRNGDPRPASKLKSSHPTIGVRNRNRTKDSSRARANSTTSQRSDPAAASHMLHPPPSSSNLSSSSTHGHGIPAHSTNRLPSVEPPAPLLGPSASSYPGPLSTTPGPGPPHHYNSPPGTSGEASQPPPSTSNGGPGGSGGSADFPSGFRDPANFHSHGHSASPASYGGPSFASQGGPSLPVPSQVGFDGYGMESSAQRRESLTLGNGETSSFGFGSAAANGIDRSGPGPVGMHQSSGFDGIGGLPRPPSDPPQDRPFTRTLVDSRPSHSRDTDDRMGPLPPLQPLDHPQHPHPHSHPSHSHQPPPPPPPTLHPPQTYHPHSHLQQQGWSDYQQWQYYPG